MNKIKKKIILSMAAVFDMNEEDIPDNATPGQIEKWDSLKHMNLIVALEEEFSIRFRDEQLEELISIELIELSIKELL